MPRQTKASEVEVVPVAWLDVTDFAEVSEDRKQVFVSSQLELQSTIVNARLTRFIGNITGKTIIGDESLELSF